MTNSVGFVNHEGLFIARMTIEFLPGAGNARKLRARVNGHASTITKATSFSYLRREIDNSCAPVARTFSIPRDAFGSRSPRSFVTSRRKTAFTAARVSRDFIPPGEHRVARKKNRRESRRVTATDASIALCAFI